MIFENKHYWKRYIHLFEWQESFPYDIPLETVTADLLLLSCYCKIKSYLIFCLLLHYCPGGHYTFFQVGVCSQDFQSVGLANWCLPLKRGTCELKISKFGGLWTENFQIWGLVSWKIPNLGACELKFGWKLRLYRLKFPNFLKRGSCKLTLLLEMGPLRITGECGKGVFRATHPHTLFLGQCPPPQHYCSMKSYKHI